MKSSFDFPILSHCFTYPLYLDDFTEYALPVFPSTFSQSPHMRFMLAHQHAGQLIDYPKVRSTILGSVGTIVVFQVSHLDADYLTQELGLDPATDQHTPALTHVPDRHAVIKVTQNGDTFSHYMTTAPPPSVTNRQGAIIRENSRNTYATPRHNIEEHIAAWYAPRPSRGHKKTASLHLD